MNGDVSQTSKHHTCFLYLKKRAADDRNRSKSAALQQNVPQGGGYVM